MEILSDCPTQTKVFTRDIIKAFIDANVESKKVEWEKTGRGYKSVYSGLREYCIRHPKKGIVVVIVNGAITLKRIAPDTSASTGESPTQPTSDPVH